MKGVPQLTVNGLRKLLQKEEGWVRWFAAGVYDAVCRGKVVSIIIWCLQNPNDDQRSEVDDMVEVVRLIRRHAHVHLISLITGLV